MSKFNLNEAVKESSLILKERMVVREKMKNEQLPDRQEEDKFTIKVETSWCADDVRMRLGEDVEHMTDKEIEEELRQLSKWMHEMCVQSGWDAIDECFEVKGDE